MRAPWFHVPLGNDEGGLTYIAAHWHGGGPDLYGHYFIDRPPLLLGIFRIAAETGGTAAVRTIGAVAVGLLVILTALLGREIGGTRAGLWAGGITAILGSSVLLGSVLTPAELIAVLPSAGSVLLLLVAQRVTRRRHLLLALAGLLAAAALLVKQSFGDAFVAGATCLIVSAYLDRENLRYWAGMAGAYAAGVAVMVFGLDLWEAANGVPDGATSYALLGFRLDGLSALAGSAGGLPGRFMDRLALPLVWSGLALVLLWSLAGLRQLSGRPRVGLTVAAWGVAGVGGVLLGGSYWPHYLIELIPVAAVTAGLALSSGRRVLVASTAAILVALSFVGPRISSNRSAVAGVLDPAPRAIGEEISARADRSDTIYVRYSQPNIAYYSGLRNPYQYDWSLMLRTIPGAEHDLRTLLRSPKRPIWLVAWEANTAYGLDANGRTAGLIRQHYRPAQRVDGTRILLERGVHRAK